MVTCGWPCEGVCKVEAACCSMERGEDLHFSAAYQHQHRQLHYRWQVGRGLARVRVGMTTNLTLPPLFPHLLDHVDPGRLFPLELQSSILPRFGANDPKGKGQSSTGPVDDVSCPRASVCVCSSWWCVIRGQSDWPHNFQRFVIRRPPAAAAAAANGSVRFHRNDPQFSSACVRLAIDWDPARGSQTNNSVAKSSQSRVRGPRAND